MTDRVCVGAIAGAFGVKGEVRLKSFCAVAEDIASYGALETEDGARAFDVSLTGVIKNGLSARLSGVPTKEAADALKGVRLFVERARLPDTDEEEFYHADLVGLVVVDPGGRELGRVKAVLNHGASDILEVATPGSKQPALLPFTRDAVPTVDIAAGRIVADPPEGVFPDE
ncbi:MAG: ribosome maturation factor RimM [Pseudomonadota bacterium]